MGGTTTAPSQVRRERIFGRDQAALSATVLLGGMGTAIGFAVGGLLAEQLTSSTELAGFAQTASTLGAGIAAYPLAALAQRFSRRTALIVGLLTALAGTVFIVTASAVGFAPLFFLGMFCFGSSTAVGFQARFAATDSVSPHLRARAMSIVVWATTIGAAAGPNLAGPAGAMGRSLGLSEFAGPFLIAGCVFLLACASAFVVRPLPQAAEADSSAAAESPVAAGRGSSGIVGALRAVAARPIALLGLSTVVIGHVLMVSVMVMTPIHMHHHGGGIEIVGIVISLHVLGMYAFSPVFGWLVDKIGAKAVIGIGFVIYVGALGFGLLDGLTTLSPSRVMLALFLLGLGWSAWLIAGSALLTTAVPAEHRISTQGTTDTLMNFGAALFAALGGPLLAFGGFAAINSAALVVLAIAAVIIVACLRAERRGAHG